MERVFEITLAVMTAKIRDESELDALDWRGVVSYLLGEETACTYVVDSRLVRDPD